MHADARWVITGHHRCAVDLGPRPLNGTPDPQPLDPLLQLAPRTHAHNRPECRRSASASLDTRAHLLQSARGQAPGRAAAAHHRVADIPICVCFHHTHATPHARGQRTARATAHAANAPLRSPPPPLFSPAEAVAEVTGQKEGHDHYFFSLDHFQHIFKVRPFGSFALNDTFTYLLWCQPPLI
jgi:hypothetical protein